MTHNEVLLNDFWQRYLDSLELESDSSPPTTYFDVWHFGNSAKMAIDLAGLVLAGKKTATSSLKWSLDSSDEKYPKVGALSIITDFDGIPMMIIETLEIIEWNFDEVTEDIGHQEGEGDRTLAYWRSAHWEFFAKECETISKTPSEKMPIVSEIFRLIYRE